MPSQKENAALQGGVGKSLCPQPIKAPPLPQADILFTALRVCIAAYDADPTPTRLAITRAVGLCYRAAVRQESKCTPIS
jgi:hypothetical protein